MLEKLKFWTNWSSIPKRQENQTTTSTNTSFKGILDQKAIMKYAVPEQPKTQNDSQLSYPKYYYPNINDKKIIKYAVPMIDEDRPDTPIMKYAVPMIDEDRPDTPIMKYAVPMLNEDRPDAPNLMYAVPMINPDLIKPEETPNMKYAVPPIE